MFPAFFIFSSFLLVSFFCEQIAAPATWWIWCFGNTAKVRSCWSADVGMAELVVVDGFVCLGEKNNWRGGLWVVVVELEWVGHGLFGCCHGDLTAVMY
jgi:hypothetical protein